ncbi:far upstream element-binding protein 2 isoform X2 [Manihot esculenta]|uniref:far upstream element-binding protein 2 isoform X2 n=1 Tax=Manihot esculenta TaxID=3983 RepID=UPI001CC4DC0D|nr:far upstream element-binding protein 2 isoform X2 [Manihot esculenta]
MAEEEVVAPAASPIPSDHKRKLEDLEPEAPQPTEANPEQEAEVSAEPDADKKADEVVGGDSPEAKRLRVDEDKPDGLASENGFEGAKSEEDAKEEPGVENEQAEDAALPPSEGVSETTGKEEPAADTHDTVDTQNASLDDSKTDDAEKNEESEKHSEEDEDPASDTQTTSRKMEVPNDKNEFGRCFINAALQVGVLIGKGGDTIRYLQYNSGAKIQITRDADADPQSTTRPVELIGTLSSIKKAEKLINAVIAEADAGGSPSLVARGLPSAQTGGVGDQLEMQVPNEKVGLIIGRGGDTIKALQAKSGARIQLIPQHLPEGDGSKERTVRVTGDRKQIEMAREMIKDVMNQTVRSSPYSGSFNQQHSYRPRGPTGPSNWGPRGPHSSQPSPYDYHHRGPYPSQNSQYPPPSYGGYPPQQMGPRGNFGSGWEQRPPSMQGPVPHGGVYDYYGGQGGHASDHPVSGPISTPASGHAPGPSATPTMSHPPSQANYNYGQSHGPDYGHQAPYSQAVPSQQSYGHGYDEPKYDNHAPMQHPYGHGNSQPVYGQAGNQPGYGAQQQYGKQPPYGMPSQGPPPQSYGPPRPGQPGDLPYQGPIQSGQSYGPNVPPQQQYPYVSSGPMQQSYPQYGSASGADGYNQAMPTSGPGYPQQGGQPVPSYGQSGGQQATGYVQGPTGGYGSYPSSQQGYAEQAAPNSAGYGYQGSQDTAYGSGPGATYSAPPSGQQAFAQPTATQPTYDQSVPQSGGYGAAPGSAPVGYGKTLSPQPTYPQYDSTTQMYVAPR